MGEVVDMFAFKKKEVIKMDKPEESFDFSEVMKNNKKNQDRVSEEQAKANKGVKRSHRLQDNDPNNKRR